MTVETLSGEEEQRHDTGGSLRRDAKFQAVGRTDFIGLARIVPIADVNSRVEDQSSRAVVKSLFTVGALIEVVAIATVDPVHNAGTAVNVTAGIAVGFLSSSDSTVTDD